MFGNPCNFRTLGRFKCSLLATDIWNGLPADEILQAEAFGWCTTLKDVRCCKCTWLVQLYCSYVYEVYYSKKIFICIMQLRLRSFRYVMMYVLLINKMWAHTALHFCWRKEAKTGQCSTYKCKPKFSIVMNSYIKYHEEVGLRQCVLIEFMSVNGLCCSL